MVDRRVKTIARKTFKWLLILILLSLLPILVLRWVPVPGSMLMIERWMEARGNEGFELRHNWIAYRQIPDNIKMAVIAAEDQRFAQHHGFDLKAIRAAMQHNQRGGSLRGASTLSQQVAKNLFLWSGRSWPRKGLEAWFTALIELLWPKERILEVYLNSVEWGVGIFGAEAAARHHFGTGAPYLSASQASLLAAVLPNPRNWSAGRPSRQTTSRAAWIRQQVRQLGGSHYLQRMRPEYPTWWPAWL